MVTISIILASKRLLAAMTSTAANNSSTGLRPVPVNRGMFPMTYSKAFSLWWASDRHSATEAQKEVLSFLPFFPESDGKKVAKVNLVPLSGRNRAINEVEIIRKDEPVERTLVMLHGYGAGLGLFYRNFDGLSNVPGTRLYALDLLGMGNSGRPHFRVHSKDPVGRIDEAEGFFIDALEEWRKSKNIEKMTLLVPSPGQSIYIFENETDIM